MNGMEPNETQRRAGWQVAVACLATAAIGAAFGLIAIALGFSNPGLYAGVACVFCIPYAMYAFGTPLPENPRKLVNLLGVFVIGLLLLQDVAGVRTIGNLGDFGLRERLGVDVKFQDVETTPATQWVLDEAKRKEVEAKYGIPDPYAPTTLQPTGQIPGQMPATTNPTASPAPPPATQSAAPPAVSAPIPPAVAEIKR